MTINTSSTMDHTGLAKVSQLTLKVRVQNRLALAHAHKSTPSSHPVISALKVRFTRLILNESDRLE